jgi:hypothetical protein
MVVPTVLYGAECWILSERQESRTDAADVEFLLVGALVRYRRTDQTKQSDKN